MASDNVKMLKIGKVVAWVQCYFGIITHCLPLDQNVLKIQTLGDDLASLAKPFLVPNLTLPNFGKRFVQPLELHFLILAMGRLMLNHWRCSKA